jgi:hypothetical protein
MEALKLNPTLTGELDLLELADPSECAKEEHLVTLLGSSLGAAGLEDPGNGSALAFPFPGGGSKASWISLSPICWSSWREQITTTRLLTSSPFDLMAPSCWSRL